MAEDKYIGKWVFPETDNPLDFVGRKGEHDLRDVAAYIIEKLEIGRDDKVLDVCCGNGLVTSIIAKNCREIDGVDFSAVLIAQANELSKADNASYQEGDAGTVDELFEPHSFDKIYISVAFQYFNEELGRRVIQNLSRLVRPGGKILLTDIPDRGRKTYHKARALMRLVGIGDGGRFSGLAERYRYAKRQLLNAIRRDKGENLIGWWWRRDDLAKQAANVGLECTILDIPKHLPHHYYRFDALLRAPDDK